MSVDASRCGTTIRKTNESERLTEMVTMERFENDFSLPRSREHALTQQEGESLFLFSFLFIKYESRFRTVLLFNLNALNQLDTSDRNILWRNDLMGTSVICEARSFRLLLFFFQNLYQPRTHTTVCVCIFIFMNGSLAADFIIYCLLWCSHAIPVSHFKTKPTIVLFNPTQSPECCVRALRVYVWVWVQNLTIIQFTQQNIYQWYFVVDT